MSVDARANVGEVYEDEDGNTFEVFAFHTHWKTRLRLVNFASFNTGWHYVLEEADFLAEHTLVNLAY